MPNPETPSFDRGYTSLADAPGADMNLDDLFPNPEVVPQPPQAAAPETPPQATPQAPPQEQFYLRSADGRIVYRTPEDAINGIAHKDELVDRYRTFLKDQGYDPNTLQKVPEQPQAQTPPSPYTYYGNPKKFHDDLAQASSDPEKWGRIMDAYQEEQFAARLAGVQPLIAEVARTRVARELSTEIPEFRSFAESERLNKVIDQLPALKNGMAMCEANISVPGAVQQLRELMKIAYLVDQGLQPRVQTQQAPTPVNPTPVVRPSTMTPPAPGVPTANWATDREARKQLIRDAQARGTADANWDKVGF